MASIAGAEAAAAASSSPEVNGKENASRKEADSLPPTQATEAVLVVSEEMPADAQKVEELDFNKFKGRPITVDDLYQGMKHMGFQASAIGEAIRIINDMVRPTNC